MKYIPHEYQKYAGQFITEHKEAILLLDMGLGKTVITLQAIMKLMFDRFEVGKVLVIAPLRVANNTWPQERAKWDGLDFLRMSVVTGTEAQRRQALQADADVYVINRENVKWLVEQYEGTHGSTRWPFDMAVIDELSSFKNARSQRFKYLKKMRPFIKRIIGLTGTPASNGLMDLWAEVAIIDGGKRLGRFISHYREKYFVAASTNPYTGVVYKYAPRPGAEEKIYDRISDISISMAALDYLDMPKKLVVEHRVQMDEAEREVYERMKKDMIATVDGEEIDAANAAVLSGKLLQLANGAIYGPDGDVIDLHSQKLDMLEDLVEQANGQSVLIAYWFRHDRKRIMERMDVRELKTEQDFTDWNAGKIPVAIISPASAGHGLNLQDGGHILIWFSQVWSLEMVQQTEARLWRQGQKNAVSIHHIVCEDTIDEAVIKAVKNKDTTQAKLIEAVKAQIGEGKEE